METAKPGVSVLSLCEKGDAYIMAETGKVFKKEKEMKKGEVKADASESVFIRVKWGGSIKSLYADMQIVCIVFVCHTTSISFNNSRDFKTTNMGAEYDHVSLLGDPSVAPYILV